ncbi:hypothetical protein [Nonomuraea sp. NPDC003804]|uniref:hypothetical protein n=1 Tax=Nonomuraea sp. NPDC003804 TaxID=3154547 RepID=UPI0033B3E1BE
MNPLGPSFLWRMCCLLVLAVAVSMVAGMRESRPVEPPFPGRIDTVMVEGRVLILQVFGGASGSACLQADKVEAVESEASVRLRIVLRDACPPPGRTLLEMWRDELWPPAVLDILRGVEVPVLLERPLGRRKVVDETGRELRVCPITGSRRKTMQQCLT